MFLEELHPLPTIPLPFPSYCAPSNLAFCRPGCFTGWSVTPTSGCTTKNSISLHHCKSCHYCVTKYSISLLHQKVVMTVSQNIHVTAASESCHYCITKYSMSLLHQKVVITVSQSTACHCCIRKLSLLR